MAKLIPTYDLAIIGGGIIGLATARQALLKHPGLKVVVLEKDKVLANQQSKRNSGVVHRGIYYKKGSLKSKFCIKGSDLIEEYCKTKGLPYKEIGKLIVATREEELDQLKDLYENALSANVKDIELIETDRINKIQPGCGNALKALWSPRTAIVNWQQVAESYGRDFTDSGGLIETNYLVNKITANVKTYHLHNGFTGSHIISRGVVNCAGVFSDYFARLTGNNEHPKVVPFKGRYHILGDRLSDKIKTNIYPLPNPKLPFLGVHVTPRIDGSVIIGPTALVSLGYERYDSSRLPQLIHMYHIFVRSGLRKLVFQKGNLMAGLEEFWRYISIFRLASEIRQLLPDVKVEDLIQTDFCGIRAQTVSKEGILVDDFLFETGLKPEFSRVMHIRNCPSPAATSSLAIAERIVITLEHQRII